MVAASRHHFSHNPFRAPTSIENRNPTLRSILDFVERDQRGATDAYLPPDNRYYKMIEREMALGESEANLYQLRRSYVREKRVDLSYSYREYGCRRPQRAVHQGCMGDSKFKR